MKVGTVGLCGMTLAGFFACGSLLGCGGSGVHTPIHQAETSRIYLEWVPQDSFRASHPATLPPTVIHAALRGLRVQKPNADLGELLAGRQKPKRIFSDEDVELLTPHILSALSQATPEEHVVFQRIYPWDYGSRMTAGTLSLHEDLIFLTITRYTQKPEGVNFAYVDDRQAPDPTGLGDRTVLFIPQEALRPEKPPLEVQHPDEVTLAIYYPLLETLREPPEQPASTRVRQTGTPSPADTQEAIVAPIIKQNAAHGHEEVESENHALRALEEQVHKQEQDLEQLKKELQEIQQSRNPH